MDVMPFEAPKESVLLSPVVKTGRDRPGAGPQGQLCAWAAWAGASQRLDVPCPGWHRGARSGDLVAACSGVPLSLGACPWRIVTLGSSGDSVCRRRGAKGGLPAHGCSPGPVPVGISSHALRIFVLPVGFCAFSLFFFSTPPASPTKTLILPSRPGDLHRKLTLRTAKERPAEEARPECGVWLFVCPLSRRRTMRGHGHPPDPRHPRCPLGGADTRILPSVRDFGMLPCTTQGTAPSFVLGRGEFGRESPAVCQQPPEAECWGGGPPMRGFHHPALTAFNMLMTLCRAGAALCKTHVQPSVMDICSETRC